MITILFKAHREKDGFDSLYSLKITGHGPGEKGQDLLCAAVSSIFIGGINALEDKNWDISVKSGDSKAENNLVLSDHDKTVLSVLCIQLYTVMKAYPNDVHVKVVNDDNETIDVNLK